MQRDAEAARQWAQAHNIPIPGESLLGREFFDLAKDIIGLTSGVHRVVMVDEFAVSEEEGFALRFVLGVLHAKGVANDSRGVGEKGKGEREFVREGFLFFNGVHRDSGDFDLMIRECRKCSPQRLHLLGSSRGVRFGVEEDDGPWSGGLALEREGIPILIRS